MGVSSGDYSRFIRGTIQTGTAGRAELLGDDGKKTVIGGGREYKQRLVLDGVDHPAARVGCRLLGSGESAKKGIAARALGRDEVTIRLKRSDLDGKEQLVAVKAQSLARHLLLDVDEIRSADSKGELEGFLRTQKKGVVNRFTWDDVETRESFGEALGRSSKSVYQYAKKKLLEGQHGIFQFTDQKVFLSRLGGRIHIARPGKKLGEGSFGRVSQITHKLLAELFALKEIKSRDGSATEEVRHEQRIMVILQDFLALEGRKEPGLPSVPRFVRQFTVGRLGAGSESNVPGLLMPFFSGGDTTKLIGKVGLPGMKQLASALCFCHTHGIVHRDLKPENIFYNLDSESEVQNDLVLGDFGGALELSTIQKRLDEIQSMKDGGRSDEDIKWAVEDLADELSFGTPGFLRGLLPVIEDQMSILNMDNGDFAHIYAAIKEGDGAKVKDLLCKADVYALGISFIKLISEEKANILNLEYMVANSLLPKDELKNIMIRLFADDGKADIDDVIKDWSFSVSDHGEVSAEFIVKMVRAMCSDIRHGKMSSDDVDKVIDALYDGKSTGEIELSFIEDGKFEEMALPLELRGLLEKMVAAKPSDRCTMQEVMEALR